MADLSGLKKRVGLIDLRLKTAHSARERESAALMEIWEQIRERFVEQNSEITRLRDRVTALEDAREELLGMVHGLLSAVESGLDRMSDETVPQIKVMADKLLNEDGERLVEQLPSPASYSEALEGASSESEEEDYFVHAQNDLEDAVQENVNFHGDLLDAIERSLEDVDESISHQAANGGEDILNRPPSPQQHAKEPVSPGIRDLIARIERSVGPDFIELTKQPEDNDDLDDELTRDLREIEALRGELHGLRERMSGSAR